MRLICSIFTLGTLAISILVVVQHAPSYPKWGASNIPRSVAVGFSSIFASRTVIRIPKIGTDISEANNEIVSAANIFEGR